MKKVALFLPGCIWITMLSAQGEMDSLLSRVERNNKALQSNTRYWEAKRADYKTGLTPFDPFVEYDFMFGSPAGAGNQRDFAITQRFDFPSVYKQKKDLSGKQAQQTRLQEQVFRQELLLEAKLLALHVIYLNKRGAELNRRRAITGQLVKDYQKKVDNGEAIILDLNKAKLQLLSISHEAALNENDRLLQLTRIMELNGGIPLTVMDTLYPELPVLPGFDELDSLIEANDPVLKVYEQEKTVLQQQFAVQKALNLPKIEAGYHSQGILGQSYRGFHIGFSIPLWENKNKLNAARSGLQHAGAAASAQILEHRLENKQYYDQLAVRRTVMKEHRDLLASLNNTALLNKALAYGQITVVQYFYEESFYFTAYDKYLQAEWEYQQAVARLLKYRL